MDKRVKYLEKIFEEIFSVKPQFQSIGNIFNTRSIFCSSIINKDEIDLISSWMDKKPKKYKLLLDSKVDDDSTSTFYKKCSCKCPTIVLLNRMMDIVLEDIQVYFGQKMVMEMIQKVFFSLWILKNNIIV